MKIKELENMLQTVSLVILALLKRVRGTQLGAYENVVFIFTVVFVFYIIHRMCVRFGKDYPIVDEWEEKLDLMTIVAYGVMVFLLTILNVTNIIIMAVIGILLIAINVLIKTKRRKILKEKN